MATVVSLTETKIRELLAGYEGVALSQDEINALISQLLVSQTTVTAEMDELKNITIPQLETDLAAGSIRVSELNDTTLPALEASLSQHDLDLENLNTVVIPALQTDLASTAQNVTDHPKAYDTATIPTNPDEDNRDLVVGDTWYDPNDQHRQYTWNGVEWSTYEVDVPDFSLTARKFLSTIHQIY